jgi:membrane-anchored protein YejM (alkaline phosphatase superfamily)
MKKENSSTPSRLAAFVFATVLPLAAALALLPGEFSHYKRWLELGADETALRLAVLSTIFSKTLVALLVCIAFLAYCARSVQPRTLRILSLFTSLVVLGLLVADLELQEIVGNNISDYLPYLLDPSTFRWAGEGFDVGPALSRVARKLAVAFVLAGLVAWIFERWVARSPGRRGRLAVAGLVGFALLPLIAKPFLLGASGTPAILYHLNERLPWTSSVDFRRLNTAMQSSQSQVQELYTRALPELARTPHRAGRLLEEGPTATPDILIVVVESLRHDVLDRETMPNVWAMSAPVAESQSQRGVRLDTHYATSNASHYGMFAMLYGRSPIFYYQTLDALEPPTLPNQLREWGYNTHYVTCTDIHWREMDRFLGPPHFIVESMQGGSLEDCDREVVSRAATLLQPGERAPRLVLVFLMSTHFGYHYPTGVEPFGPASDPPNALDLDASRDREALMNRYRNSAHYVDSLIGSLFDRIAFEQTLVVVTGDHGESLFDDGTIAHSSRLSEIQTRVPLAMSGPGFSSQTIRRGPTDHSDLLPTLFARLGVEPEELAAYPGRDLLGAGAAEFVPLVQAKARRSTRDRVALVSYESRYSMRLDAARGEMRFLGKMKTDGRPSRESVSQIEGARAVRWFDHYLESIKGH